MLLQGPHAPAAGKEVGLLPSGPGNAWHLPEGFGLFAAEFSREGADLILEDAGGERLRLVDYFAGETPADVHSHNGASLSGAVVARLAGPLFPGQYAQAGGGRDLADAIGQVETLDGTAYVQRTDGATEVLAIGTKVFQGDVVRTGDNGLLGITFADGTVFTLAAGSRMVLDELIYDPDGADNKGVFSLVEGSFVFIAGQAAATGGMEVNTPTATMGIRGTTVKVDIQTQDGISTVSVSLNPDFDGGTGAIQLFTLDGELIANITSTDSKWIISPPDSAIPPIEVERTESDIADDSILLSQAVAALQSALNRVEQGQTFVDLPPSSSTDDAGPPGEGGDLAPPGGTDPGDIPSDGTDLDGQDEGLPEGEGSEEGTDDASLTPPSAPPPGPSGPSGVPQITVTSVQSTEDTPLTGNLGVTDANGDEVEVTLTQGAQNGQVVLLADGTFTYTPNENFEGTDSFTVTATDTTGASSESEVTVTVDAVNDAPVVTALQASGSTTETGAAGGPGAAPVTGNFTYADVDETEPATWSIIAAPETVAPIGTITINAATGAWDYLLDEGAADPLAEGEEVVETYIATVTDAEGASASEVVEVTIIGANDGPVIAEAPFSGALAEDITGFANLPDGVAAAETEPAATGSLSGQFTFFDVDQRDQPGAWSWQADPGNETSFGAFEIDPLAGTWSYTLDQAAADVLGNDESVTETYIATVTDEFGASASQSVTVTITGFNDAPTILYSLEDITGTVFEEGFEPEAPGAPALAAFRVAAFDAAGADASGTLSYNDPDGQPDETVTWNVEPENASFGTMTIDQEGHWHYFLDEAAAQSLKEGEERIETFTATVTDALGQASSQVITITVIGANDESEIIALPQDLQGAVAEGGTQTATGTLTYLDPDAAEDEVATWSIGADGASRGSMVIGPLDGAWVYDLDDALANDLGEGEVVQETFTATLTDALGATAAQTITISITGQNDAPLATGGDTSGMVKEAGDDGPGMPQASGTLTYSDPDLDGTLALWSAAASPLNSTTYGQFVLDPGSGAWTYDIDQAAAEALQEGESATEVFTATVTDFYGASDSIDVSIEIKGSNDAPTLVDTSASLTEDTPEIVIDLAALGSDPDAGEDGSTLSYQLLSATPVGTAQILGSSLTFTTGTDFQELSQGESATVELLVLATDQRGATDTGQVSLTVTGLNDAPTLTGASRTVAEGDAPLSIDLAALADDPDTDASGATLTYQLVGPPLSGAARIEGTELIFDQAGEFDALAAGESQNVTIVVDAVDQYGARATASYDVVVEGRNDPPVIQPGSDRTGTVTEPVTPNQGQPQSVSGTLSYVDVDAPSPLDGTWSTSPSSGAFGSFQIDQQTGSWTYILNETAAESLRAGETRTESFTATITDVDGGSDSTQVIITVRGTNDAPILSGTSGSLGEEEASIVFNLAPLAGDVDAGDSASFSLLSSPAAGSAVLNGSSLTFFTNGDFDGLAEGESQLISLNVQVQDSAGATDTATVAITVVGRNDGPEILGTSVIEGTVVEPGDPAGATVTATGTLRYADADAASPDEGTWTISPLGAAFGTISIDPRTGVWTYRLDAEAADSLNEGETRTETFTATITDAAGETDSETVTITIRGTNDAPVLEDGSGSVGEDQASVGVPLAPLFSDVDSGDTFGNAIFTILSPPALGSALISGGSLTFRTDGDFEHLAEGETSEVQIGLRVRDPQGGTDEATVTITVVGANDAPVILGSSVTSGTVVEPGPVSGPAITATGLMRYDDVDAASPTEGDWTISPLGTALGQMIIDRDSGHWTYTLDRAAADSLNEGETRTETFTATITDAEGATDSETVTITIRGTNDAPVLEDGSGSVGEDQASVGVPLAPLFSDVDSGDTFGNAIFTILSPPALGSALISGGSLTFRTDVDFEHLAEGETSEVQIGLRVRDPQGGTDEATVTITVVGANDAPVILGSSVTSGTVVEPGPVSGPAITATGLMRYDDVDAASPTEGDWTISPLGTALGQMIIDRDSGHWTYTLDRAAADSLNEGETRTETFTATITDAAGATDSETVTITIRGTNDAPVLEDGSGSVGEDQASVGVPLAPLFSDVDSGDTFGNAIFTILSPPALGSALISGGSLTFRTDVDFEHLAEGETSEVQIGLRVRDPQGGTDEATVTITVVGANDAPVILGSSVTSGTVVEPGPVSGPAITATGLMRYDDVDAASPTEGGWTISPLGTALGQMIIDRDSGHWTYTLDRAAADSLNEGETRTETFTATITDAAGATDTETVTITIRGTNDAPTINADSATTTEEASTEIDLLPLADDADGAHSPTDLQFNHGGAPTQGTVAVNNRKLVFDPDGDFEYLSVGQSENVLIPITVTDPLGASATAMMAITVTGVNDAPTLTDGTATATEDGPAVSIDLALLGDDVDSEDDGSSLFYTITGQPSVGTATVAGSTLTFNPGNGFQDLNTGETRTVDIDVVARDKRGAFSGEKTVTVTVNGTNDAPVATDQNVTVDMGDLREDGASYFAPNGHYYKIKWEAKPWDDARADALAKGGYLASITSQAEEDFVQMLAGGQSLWLGGTDADLEGVWKWVDGPEDGEIFWNGGPVGDGFTDWSPGQPDNFLNEDYIESYFQGPDWNDANGQFNLPYPVEFTPQLSGSVAGNGSDVDDTVLTFETVEGIPGLTMSASGAWTLDLTKHSYTALSDGEELELTTKYRVTDPGGLSDIADLTITVVGANDAPVARGDLTVTDEETILTGNLFTDNSAGIDSDPDGDGFTIHTVDGALPTFGTPITLGSGATLTVHSNGDFIFDPRGAFDFVAVGGASSDGINYTIVDSSGAVSNEVRANFSVTGLDDAPVISIMDFAPVDEGNTGVLSNVIFDPSTILTASDLDNGETPEIAPNTLSITAVKGSATAITAPFSIGTITAVVDTANYDFLKLGESGLFHLSFDVVSGEQSSTHSATIEITGVNDTPVANPDPTTTAEDTPISIDVLANDTDVDGDTLVVGGLTQPSNGTVAVNDAGQVTYTPDKNYNGTDTFTYSTSDGAGGEATGSVTVTVTAINDPVHTRADFASTDENTAVTIDVLANDSDPEGGNISISSVGSAGNGQVTTNGATVIYTPASGFFGIDTFTYQATDSTAGTVTETVTVVVNQDSNAVQLPTGFSAPTLSFNIAGGGGSPAGSFSIDLVPFASNGVNIAFGLDESGSILEVPFETMIDSVKTAVSNMVSDFTGSSTSLDVHITPFDGNVDVSGSLKPQSFTVYTSAGGTNLAAFNTYMDGVKMAYNGGATNWDDAFLNIKGFFDGQEASSPNDVNIAYFITDGNPNVNGTTDWQTTTGQLRGSPLDVDIKAFAIGSNITITNLEAIDPGFDSATQTLASASDLLAAFDASPLFNARLTDFSLVLIRDNESLGVIADEKIFTTPLTSIAFEHPLADIDGLSGLLGDMNTFVATAKFDTDGDLASTADVLQFVTQQDFAKASIEQHLSGTSENDLLLGSDFNDTLDGGIGDDIILGFGSSDSILGGPGDDRIAVSGIGAQLIDGGAGRDVLTINTDVDITTSILSNLNIQDIEVLDLTNNENNILTLRADDVIDLSSTPDTTIAALLSSSFSGLSDILTILGDVGDTLVLEDSANRFYRNAPTETVMDSNVDYGIYAIEDSTGTIVGAVAVEQDIAVSYPVATNTPTPPHSFLQIGSGPALELEIGLVEGLGAGTGTVDLSGIDELDPTKLKDTAEIDMRNGQKNELSIDVADLLNLIEGNGSTHTEEIWVLTDPEDTVNFVDDGAGVGFQGWEAEYQSSSPETYSIKDTGRFVGYADTFATIYIDDGSSVPS